MWEGCIYFVNVYIYFICKKKIFQYILRSRVIVWESAFRLTLYKRVHHFLSEYSNIQPNDANLHIIWGTSFLSWQLNWGNTRFDSTKSAHLQHKIRQLMVFSHQLLTMWLNRVSWLSEMSKKIKYIIHQISNYMREKKKIPRNGHWLSIQS